MYAAINKSGCTEHHSFPFTFPFFFDAEPYIPFAYTVEIRDATDNLIAMLENAHGIGYVQTINAPHSLRFSLPSDDGKLVNIILANQLWLRSSKTGEVMRKFQLQRKMDVRQ